MLHKMWHHFFVLTVYGRASRNLRFPHNTHVRWWNQPTFKQNKVVLLSK